MTDLTTDPSASNAGSVSVTPIAGSLGARIDGATGETLAGLAPLVREALDEHMVVCIPKVAPSPLQFRDLAASFGELEIHPYLTPADESIPEVVVLNSRDTPAADIWHTDATFLTQPPIYGVLQMVECPEVGGDTVWLNCAMAYDDLSEPMKEMLAGLTCIHGDGGQGDLTAEHPVVREDPVTGRRSLYVHNQFSRRIPQLSRPESQMLLDFLYRWQDQVRFTCRWQWSEGDVVLWDERVTLHAAVDDLDEARARKLHRAQVIGDLPTGIADSPDWPRHHANRMRSSGYYGLFNRSPEF